MKRSLLLNLIIVGIMVSAVPTSTFAQMAFAIDRGSTGISGTFSLTSQTGDLYERDEKSVTTFTIKPSLIYFVVRNLAIGADVNLSWLMQGNLKYTTLGVGPKILYAFGWHESASYPYISTGIEFTTFSNGGTVKNTAIKFNGGFFYMPSGQQHLGMVIDVGIYKESLDPGSGSAVKGTTMAISVGLIGFIF